MTVFDLLEALNNLGIQVSLHNSDLKITAPKNLAIPGLMQIIKEKKGEIVDVLRTPPTLNNFSNFKDSVDYVDYVQSTNSTQLPENNFSERMDDEHNDSLSNSLNPHNPARPSSGFSNNETVNLQTSFENSSGAVSERENKLKDATNIRTVDSSTSARTLSDSKGAEREPQLNRIFVDFETRSEADLKKVGGILYSEHPSTDILCLGILDASSMDKPIIFTSEDIQTRRQIITELVQNENNIFVACWPTLRMAIYWPSSKWVSLLTWLF